MRTVVSNHEVPHLWAHQAQPNAKNHTGSLYFEGKTIYSYGSHFPIATFTENKAGQTAVLFTTNTYSVTTTGHCSAVRSAISHISPIFHVPLGRIRWGSVNAGDFLPSYQSRIEESQNAVARARSENKRDYAYQSLVLLVKEANDFCEFFGLSERFEVLQDFDNLKATLSATAALKRKEEKERLRQIAEDNAEKIGRWIAGESVSLPYNLDTVYLRIEGAEVVTSRGARFPVSHAIKGLAFIRAVRSTGKEYHRNGHTLHLGHYAIDSIDSDGNVKAGCHFVAYSEIERIAPQLETLGSNA